MDEVIKKNIRRVNLIRKLTKEIERSLRDVPHERSINAHINSILDGVLYLEERLQKEKA